MSSVDDVYRNTDMLLDALVRTPPFGITGGMGQVGSFPGLVPGTYNAAQQARDDSAATLAIVKDTADLLSAVDGETLARIEAAANGTAQTMAQLAIDIAASRANTDQTLGRIESDLKQDWDFLLTVRSDLNDVSSKLDTLTGQLQQDMIELNAKLDALASQVEALPQK